jgi:AAA15 family ATPase/GTPase
MIPNILAPELRDRLIADMYGKELTSVKFVHDSSAGSGILDLNEESQGTQKLFAFAGPWLDVLARGKVLVVDELDTSLHPLLVRHLVGLFHNPKTNPLNAQLLISTHDTTLLDPATYRRDQVWFTEKDEHDATSLYSLAEFRPRKNEAFERGYLKGRYGALPFIGDFSF